MGAKVKATAKFEAARALYELERSLKQTVHSLAKENKNIVGLKATLVAGKFFTFAPLTHEKAEAELKASGLELGERF